jgi:cytochrome c oxidase subunit 2
MTNLSLSPILAALPWEADYWFPPQRSTYAHEVDWVYFFIGWVSIFFFVVIMAAMAYFCVKYRRRPGQPKLKYPTHHSGLEIAWSILPSFLLVYMFYAGFVSFMDMRSMPDEAYNIVVNGQKWFWQFSYDNGKVIESGSVANDANWNDKKSIFAKVPRLHVPVNTDVVLTMNAKDVLHSFFIPAFRTKQDVVPGRYTKLWFNANEVGVYDVFCAE